MKARTLAASLVLLTVAACAPPSGSSSDKPDNTGKATEVELTTQDMPAAGNALTLSQLPSDVFAQRLAVAMNSPAPLAFDERSLQHHSAGGTVLALRYADTGLMEAASFTRAADENAPMGSGLEVDFLMAAMPMMDRDDAEDMIKAMLRKEKDSGYVARSDVGDDYISLSTTSGLLVMVEKRER